MNSPKKQKWTKERCLTSAMKYTSRSAWSKGDKKAYNAAQRYGWLEDCCVHMRNPKQKWTKERCLTSAMKYTSRSAWSKGDKKAYIAAQRYGWLDDCCAHMCKPKQKWTKERCLTSAMKYTSRSAWSKGDQKAYTAAQRYGWLDDCCQHMRNPNQKWTKERCLRAAKKFTTRSAWSEGDNNSYIAAIRNGWFEECCAHMQSPQNGWRRKWTKERCLTSAMKYTSRKAWREGDENAYRAAHRYGWFEDCCANMQSPQNGRRRKWTKEQCLTSSMKYTSRSAWREGDENAYSAAHRYGWFEDCCAHMQSPQNGRRRKWTKERCLKSAMKYTSRSNWAEGDSRAYGAAYRHGWLEDCCAHMQRKRLIFKSPRQLRFR